MDSRSLKYTYSRIESINDFLECLKRNPHSSTPYFRIRVDLHEDSIKIIADNLKHCPVGTRVELARCDHNYHICMQQMKYLAEALGRGEAPEDFYLDASGLGLGDEGAEYFANALKTGKVKKGTCLDLGYNGITENGIQTLASSLENSPEHFCLDLSNNMFTPSAYNALGDNLKKARKDFHLFIFNHTGNAILYKKHECFIPSLDAVDLPPGLKINIRWALLLDNKGVKRLNQALQKNTSLVEFEFTWVGHEDGEEKHLLKLYLKRNRLLARYPGFEKYIKAKCHEHNLYVPSVANSFAAGNSSDASVSEQNLFSSREPNVEGIPGEITEFFREVTHVERFYGSFRKA